MSTNRTDLPDPDDVDEFGHRLRRAVGDARTDVPAREVMGRGRWLRRRRTGSGVAGVVLALVAATGGVWGWQAAVGASRHAFDAACHRIWQQANPDHPQPMPPLVIDLGSGQPGARVYADKYSVLACEHANGAYGGWVSGRIAPLHGATQIMELILAVPKHLTPSQAAELAHSINPAWTDKIVFGIAAADVTSVDLILDDGTVVHPKLHHGLFAYIDPQGRTRYLRVVPHLGH